VTEHDREWWNQARADGPSGFPYMATIVPAGRLGDVQVEHLEITDGGGIHAMLHGGGTRNGTYAILKIRRSVVMSDTDMERRSNLGVILDAQGDVLIGGLGLGMIVCPLLRKPTVRTITVIELNPDVTAHVEPAIRHWADVQGLTHFGRLNIVQGDVYTWKPAKGQKFDAIYFDVWPDISEDNLDGIARLHARAKFWKRPGGFLDSWQADNLRSRRRADRRRNPWDY
jgi:spermidine synthase